MGDNEKERNLLTKLAGLWRNGLFRSLLMLIILMLGVFAFQRLLILILGTDYPLTTPISDSMYPTLKVGDLLIVQGGFKGEDIYAHPGDGDIIVFEDPMGRPVPIVHRAINKYYDNASKKWLFITKGDKYGLGTDPLPVSEDKIYGKVIFVIPYLGYIKIWLGNEVGIFLIALLLITLLIFENWDLLKKKRGKAKSCEKNQLAH